MDKVCEELDETKAELEKLRADYRSKAELSESLKRAHNEQLIKIQEASSKLEKQAQELNEKAEENSVVKQMYEDVKCSLIEKESIIKRLSAANDKLRVGSDEKYQKLEEQNKELVFALDEANEKNIDQEQKINVFKAEIEGLKGLLSVSQNKCLEAEKRAKASKELRERDGVLLKLEEEKRKAEDQLKWKKEQFKHLEEAHDKLRDQFRATKKEWELEKSTLVDEICSLQTSLDSQTRISEDLQHRLKMCNHALAHEESRRKYLEVEVSEYKARFENVFTECQDTKSQLECLTTQRDEEIAALRHSLGTKETFYKEREYRAGKLEQENQELLTSLKELQEAQIHQAGSSSSLAKLRNKLKSVEQMHRDCSANLRAKEAEWSSQLEKMIADLNDCRSELEVRDAAIEVLKMELEGCHSLIMQLRMQNEESSVMLQVLKSGISEAQLKLTDVDAEMGFRNKEREEIVSQLMKQLETKNTALAKAQKDIDEEREKAASLLRRVESLDDIEEQQLLMQKELERYKEMLEESSRCQLRMKEQALQTEAEWSSQLEKMTADLNDCRSELEVKDAAIEELKMELEGCHSLIMQLRMQNEESSVMLLVLKSGISEAQLKLTDVEAEMGFRNKEREEIVARLMKQLETKNTALAKAQKDIDEERERAASLLRRVESLDDIEEQQLLMQKELERYKEMLEESSRCQLHMKEQALQTECDLKDKLREVCDALDMENSELAKEREKAATLSRKVESSDVIEEQRLLMQKELERCKEMLEESSKYQLRLEEQALQMESDSKEKLREVCDALDTAISELVEEREKAASLSRRVESLDHIEEQQILMQKELERYKEMFEESSRCQVRLEEQALQMESDSKGKLKEVCDALDTANSELAEEREKTATLLRRVELLEHNEEEQCLMQKELENYKELLEESFRCQLRLEEQALQRENDTKRKLTEVCDALDTANSVLAEECEKASSLSRRLESLDHIEEQKLLMQKELERYKELFEESSRGQLRLEEKALQMESDSKWKLKEVCDALDTANSQLAEKICEGHEIEFELWIWKSIAERLKADLEENQELRKELEASLLAQTEVGETIKQEKDGLVHMVEEKDSRMSNLQQQIVLLEQELKIRGLEAASSAKIETAMSFESEKESFLHITREKNKILEKLQKEIGWLEQESLRRELEGVVFTQICAERTFEHEKENLVQLVEEKDQRIDDLLQLVRSSEQNFNSSLNSVSSQLAEKQAEIYLVYEAWEKIAAAEILAELEIEEKKLMIVELEDDICNIQQKLELQEQSLSRTKQQALEIETELEAKQLAMKTLTNQMEAKLRISDALIDELKSEKSNLVEDVVKLSSERENLLCFIGGLGDRISKISNEDMQLMGTLGRIVQAFDNSGSDVVLKGNDELFDSVKENLNAHPSPTSKNFGTILEDRSPFRQLN